jgi:uncharacterized membrane protein
MSDPTRTGASAKALAGLFVIAGILHFTHTRYYLKIVPPYLPWPRELVYLSGVAEMAGGVGVLVPRLRRPAGWGLIALLVAVFPANLYHALHPEQTTGDAVPPALLWARLPFQALFMAWVWQATLRRR